MLASDLNAVGAFAKVVEHKSFRAAALALGIPKSTLSRKVAELEDELGARLLERTTRRLRLTDAGTAYYLRVRPALDSLREAELALEQLGSEPAGPLRVTMTVEGGQTLLAPVLAEYVTRYPKVELNVELMDRRVDLIAEGFDVAIRAGALTDSSLIAHKLGALGHLRVYGSPSYFARRGVPRHPRELAEHDCLLMSSQSAPADWSFQHAGRAFHVKVNGRSQVNSFMLLRELSIAGHGITRLPCYMAGDAVKAGLLRCVLDSFAPPPGPWHAVYPSSRNLSPKVRAFIELLEAHFGRDQRRERSATSRDA
ncbi:MAG: LysR substrate-binding domain-containing protein [Myxococcota bacterium]